MKNNVKVDMIIGLYNPYEQKKDESIKEHELKSNCTMSKVDKDNLNKYVDDVIKKFETEMGGVCVYGHANVYINKDLKMEVTILHEAVQDNHKKVTYH